MASLSLKRIGLLTSLAVLMLILVLVSMLLTLSNQFLRQQLGEQQQIINRSIQMEALQREIVTSIATVAVKTNDAELKNLLASQGINFEGPPKTAGGAK